MKNCHWGTPSPDFPELINFQLNFSLKSAIKVEMKASWEVKAAKNNRTVQFYELITRKRRNALRTFQKCSWLRSLGFSFGFPLVSFYFRLAPSKYSKNITIMPRCDERSKQNENEVKGALVHEKQSVGNPFAESAGRKLQGSRNGFPQDAHSCRVQKAFLQEFVLFLTHTRLPTSRKRTPGFKLSERKGQGR